MRPGELLCLKQAKYPFLTIPTIPTIQYIGARSAPGRIARARARARAMRPGALFYYIIAGALLYYYIMLVPFYIIARARACTCNEARHMRPHEQWGFTFML